MTAHVRTEAGVKKYHEPIGSPIVKHRATGGAPGPSLDDLLKYLAPTGEFLTEQHPSGKPTYAEIAEDYGWDEIDAKGTDGRAITNDSIHVGHQAQINAKWWQAHIGSNDSDDDQYAASLWEQYQSPQLYGAINHTLRDDEAQDVDGNMGPDPDDMRRYVDTMFREGGTKTDHPMVLYRALHSSRASTFEPGNDEGTMDWAEVLKPGSTFTDKGIMSTTPHPKFSQGWLGLNSVGGEIDEQKPDDVVLEIHAPAGTQILGGDPQFIEVMLGRGTTLKVISSEQRRAEDPVNPLQAHSEDPFTYTHVVAEVVTTK